MNQNMNLHPGPLNDEVLYLRDRHRAFHVFTDEENFNRVMMVKRSDRAIWRLLRDHPVVGRVRHLIDAAGFGGLIDCGYRYVDHSLTTALVERWRPETHTFHLPFGEATVTLQDVNVLWGLPIEGAVVSGVDDNLSTADAIALCRRFLGVTPTQAQMSGKSVFGTVILDKLKQEFVEAEATDEECIFRARLILFFLIGSTLLPDNNNNRINVFYLRFLRDLNRTASYSWGSAVLACLYRRLCDATQPDRKAMTGPMMLLQVWAWERIRCLAPRPPSNRFDYTCPIAARYISQIPV